MNKRGGESVFGIPSIAIWIVLGVMAVLTLILVIIAFSGAGDDSSGNGVIKKSVDVFKDGTEKIYMGAADKAKDGQSWGVFLNKEGLDFFTVIFGKIPGWLEGGLISAIVVTIGIWILFFVTMGDIFVSFAPFSRWVSWVVALVLTIIAANIGALIWFMGLMFSIIPWLGAIGVFVSLVIAIGAFLAVNLGIKSLAGWAIRRRLLMKAHEHSAKIEAGGEEFGAAVRAIKDAGDAFAS